MTGRVLAAILAATAAASPRATADPAAPLAASQIPADASAALETSLRWKAGLAAPAASPLTWSAPARPAGTDVRVNRPGEGESLPNCNWQNETDVAVHGQIAVAGWNDGGACEFLVFPLQSISVAGVGRSTDGGRTWTDGGTIRPEPGGKVWGDPVVVAGIDGAFHYATLADDRMGRSIIGVATSIDGGRTWSAPVDASPRRASSAAQDKEWLAADTTDSPHRGNVYVAWVEFTAEQRIIFSRSTDGAATFSDPIVLQTSYLQRGTGTQVAVGPEGEVYVVWLSSEETSLYFTRSLDGGRTFSEPRRIAQLSKIGHLQDCGSIRQVMNGDIRVREFPSLAVDVSGSPDPRSPDHNPFHGRIYVAAASDGLGADEGDVFLLSSSDRGDTWTPRRRVNDDAASVDQFHPQVEVGADGTVAMAWYDRRLSGLRANWDLDVFAAASRNGGATFTPNARITDVSFPPAQTNPNSNLLADCYMGEYNGLASAGAGFLLTWGDNRDGPPVIPDPNVYADTLQP